MPLTFVGCCNSRKYVSARQNLRPLGTVTPGRWYLIGSWNSPEWQGWRKKRWLLVLTHMFAWFLNLQTFIREIKPPKASKSSVPKDIMHKMNTPQKFESERQLRTMTKTKTERWPFSEFVSPLQTHPHRESARMTSLLVRNYSCFIAAAAFSSTAVLLSYLSATTSFQSFAQFMSTNTKPSGTIGDTRNADHFSHVLSRILSDTIGLVRCSCWQTIPGKYHTTARVPLCFTFLETCSAHIMSPITIHNLSIDYALKSVLPQVAWWRFGVVLASWPSTTTLMTRRGIAANTTWFQDLLRWSAASAGWRLRRWDEKIANV